MGTLHNKEVAQKRIPTEDEVAFCKACEDSDLEQVRALLAKGVDPNAVDKDGYPALICICANLHSNQSAEIAALLLKYGADPNAPERECRSTALSYAVQGFNPDVTKLLLHYGADPLAVDSEDQTILHCAVYGCAENVKEVIEAALYRLGVDENPQKAQQDMLSHFCRTSAACISTPLHAATYTRSSRIKGSDGLNTLIEMGFPIDALDYKKYTPLMRACHDNCPDAMAALIQAGAKVTTQTWTGFSIYSLAQNMHIQKPPPPNAVLNLMFLLPQDQWLPTLKPEMAGMALDQKLSPISAAMHLGKTEWLLDQMQKSGDTQAFFEECAEVARVCDAAERTPFSDSVQDSYAAVSALKAQSILRSVMTRHSTMAQPAP